MDPGFFYRTHVVARSLTSRSFFSHSASKDPTPAYAFLQVKDDDLQELSLAVQNAVWEDAKGTFNNPSLIGPPYVELSIYKKIPIGKPKKDPKEGTIDEDDEWKKWQFSLTEDPALKKEQEEEAHTEEVTTAEPNDKRPVTALVAHILENKANKAKEAANAKSRKHARQESQGKGKSSASTEEPKKKSKDKADKPRETVKILKKQAATEAAAEAAKAVAKDIKAGASTSERTGGRRQLGLKDILKRDLGIKDTEPETKTRRGKAQEKESASSAAATPGSANQPSEPAGTAAAPKPQAEKSSRGSRRRGKDSKASESNKASGSSEAPVPAPVKPVAILQKKKEEPAAPAPTKEAGPAAKAAAATPPTGPKAGNAKGGQNGGSQKKGNPSTSAPIPAASSTRAFLKHANPSQGVTEALLRQAMGAFGGVGSVEIDRRKGFAYVEFTDHGGLVKAMAASPVTIANASVQVLERKDQTPKKTAAAPSNAAPTSTAKDTASTAAATPAPPAEKATGDQQQPKRSRRRGRGKGGNGGAGAKDEGKAGDQNGSMGGAGGSTSTPATGEVSGAG